MIERAPHTITEANGTIIKHPTFVTDNKMLFDKLAKLTREHECWTYIKPHARARNGRAAYMAFKNHNLGPNNIGNMAATAEHKLINATYRQEGRHWDFESYATLHKEQHTILEGLRKYGYAGMDEGSKTRHLLAGIKTTALDSVKTHILCNAELRQDFAKYVVLFKDYIMQTKVNKPQELNISSTTTKTEIEQKKRKPHGRVEDRYTIQEYKALSNEQKKELKDLRVNRGHNPKRRKFNKGSVKGQLAALDNKSQLQSHEGTNAGVAQNTTPSGTQHPQMPPPALKVVITIIILPSLTNEPEGDRETHGPSCP